MILQLDGQTALLQRSVNQLNHFRSGIHYRSVEAFCRLLFAFVVACIGIEFAWTDSDQLDLRIVSQ